MKKRHFILFLCLLMANIVTAQKVEDIVMQLPHLVIDRASDSLQRMEDRKSMLLTSSASIVEIDSLHQFIHIGVPQPSKKVLELRLLRDAKNEVFVAVSEFAANLDCDEYKFTVYQRINNKWLDVTSKTMPIIYFFLCIPESDPTPSTKICFDMNTNWYYNLREFRMTAEPVALKNIICMEQSVKEIAVKEGKAALDSAMHYYYNVIKTRPLKKVYLEWQPNKAAFTIVDKH